MCAFIGHLSVHAHWATEVWS